MPYVKPKKPVRTKPKYTRKSFTKSVKRIIHGDSQLKHFTSESSVTPVVSATIYTYSPTQNISAGTAISNRIADQIYLHRLKLHGYVFAAALSNANAKFRVSVVYCAQQTVATTITSGGLTYAQLFLPNTFSVNGICGVFDEKSVQVLSDQTIDLNSYITSANDIKTFTADIMLRDIKYKYIDTNSTFGQYKNLYVVVQSYSSAGANPTNCGSLFFSTDLQFKDM